MGTTVKVTNYELIYTDFSGNRQIQNHIKTKEDALWRKKEFYNFKSCNAVVKRSCKNLRR